MRRLFMMGLFLALILSACSGTALIAAPQTDGLTVVPKPRTLVVFAAASLTDAFDEIGTAFESANPGVTVTFNFSGSQALRTQIEQGARADVFASANTKEMDALVASKFVAAGNPQLFLTNQLVVILPANNPAGLNDLAGLTGDGVKLILAAQEVPVGNYSLQVIDKLDTTLGNGFKDKILANVVSYENDVKQVVAKVQLGEADAGLVYLSDTVAAPGLKKIEIPPESNVIARYPLAALARSENPEIAQSFIEFVLSPQGQFIIEKWGFLPVN